MPIAVTLLNQHLLSRTVDVRWWAKIQQDGEGIEVEKLIISRSWKQKGPYLSGGQVRCTQRKQQNLGQMTLLGSMNGVFCSFWIKSTLVNSNQKEQGLVSIMGVLSKGHIRGRLWKAWVTVYHKSHWEKSYQKPNACESVGCSLGHVLVWWANVSLRLWRSLGQTEWMMKQQHHGVA